MKHILPRLFLMMTLSIGPANADRTCRILFVGDSDHVPEKPSLFDGKVSREVELPFQNLSPVYSLASGDQTLRLRIGPAGAAKNVNPDSPSVKIPKAVTDFYLVVSRELEDGVAQFKLEIFDASKLKKGQMLWLNRTEHFLEGQMGEQKLELAPNANKVIDAPTTKKEDYAAQISIKKSETGTLLPLMKSKWRHEPEIRTVVIVVTKPGSRFPRVTGLSDRRK